MVPTHHDRGAMLFKMLFDGGKVLFQILACGDVNNFGWHLE